MLKTCRFLSILAFCLMNIVMMNQNVYSEPDTLWTRTIGTDGEDLGWYVEQTSDQGYIITGKINDMIGLIKTDEHGDTIWTKTYGTGEGHYVQQTDDEGYIMIGPLVFIKTDENGDTLWTKTFGSSIYYESGQQTSDRGYILTGRGPGNATDVILRKTDLDGNTIWTKTYGGSADEWGGYCVRQTSDQGYIITGMTGSFGAGNYDVWLIKTDENGDTVWTKTFGGSGYEYSSFVRQTADGGFIITGGTESFGSGGSDIWIIKTYANGDTAWTKTVGGADNEYGLSVQQTSNGRYIVVGFTGNNLLLVRLDESGNVLWEKNIEGDFGLEWWQMNISLQVNTDGTFIITGAKRNISDHDVWLLKVSESGSLVAVITGESVWIDDDWDGLATNTLSGTSSTPREGIAITSYLWLLDGEVAGSDSTIELTLPIGSHSVQLVVTDEAALSDTALIEIQVISADKVYPVAVINTEPSWIDADWDGSAAGVLDGNDSYSLPEGAPIVSYNWIIDSQFISVASLVNLSLKTGTHSVALAVADSHGWADTAYTLVSIFSYQLQTEGPIVSAVSTIGDSLFFISSLDDRVYHFDSTGRVRWYLWTGGDIQSTTAVGPDNTIYVGSSDTRLYAFDVNGNFKWDLPMGGMVTSSPTLDGSGNLYVGVNNGKIFSVSNTGLARWNVQTNDVVQSSASISTDGIIYIGSNDGNLYALNPEGDTVWTYHTDGPVCSSPALGSGGNVYFGSEDGKLYALSAGGEYLWDVQCGGPVRSSPVVDNGGNIYFGSGAGLVYAVDTSGVVLWNYEVASEIYASPALGPDGSIYIGCQDGRILALNSAGDLRWYYQTNGAVQSPPLVTGTGRIYIGNDEGKLYGFADPDITMGQQPIAANGYWPTFKGNNRRTGYLGEIAVGNISSEEVLPFNFYLAQNFPNPFNAMTTIKYRLKNKSKVTIRVIDIIGREIATLIDEYKPAGNHQIIWSASGYASGIYFYRITAGDFQQIRKMILLR